MRADLLRERRVAPSILSADFSRLGDQLREVLAAGARVVHVDVMDGHFVPQITIGALVVASIRELAHDAGAMLDVHLMVERPERHVADFARAGADMVTVHCEATPHAHYALAAVREAGCLAGLALNPGTPLEAAAALAADADNLLCMTVDPGWGGQPFIPGSVERVRHLRALAGDGPAIEVDGGIDAHTAGPCSGAGATLFVAGSAIFGAADPAEAYSAIAAAAGAA